MVDMGQHQPDKLQGKKLWFHGTIWMGHAFRGHIHTLDDTPKTRHLLAQRIDGLHIVVSCLVLCS